MSANEILVRAREAALESERLFGEFVRTETDGITKENGVTDGELEMTANAVAQAFVNLSAVLSQLVGLDEIAKSNAARRAVAA